LPAPSPPSSVMKRPCISGAILIALYSGLLK
jgi:hypothetical protein